jgi:hypothetical protein
MWEILADIFSVFMVWPAYLANTLNEGYVAQGVVVTVIWWMLLFWAFTGGYGVKKKKKME